jgi:hypothetical protein
MPEDIPTEPEDIKKEPPERIFLELSLPEYRLVHTSIAANASMHPLLQPVDERMNEQAAALVEEYGAEALQEVDDEQISEVREQTSELHDMLTELLSRLMRP